MSPIFRRPVYALRFKEGKSESPNESAERDRRGQKPKKQIAALQTKIRKKKHLSKQMRLNAELKKMKKELEALRCGS